MPEQFETPAQLKIDCMLLPKMNAHELRFLIDWGGSRHDKFPAFGRWLVGLCVEELERRQAEGAEPEMIELPRMNGKDWNDFLLGSLVLTHLPLSSGTAVFVDQVAMQIAAAVGGMLEHFIAEAVV